MLRRFLLCFLPGLGLLLVTVWMTDRRDVDSACAAFRVDAENLGRLQAEIIRTQVRAVRSDLLHLAEQRILQDFLTADTPEARGAVAEEYRLFCARKGIYDQVRFLDATGRERVRVNRAQDRPQIVPDESLQAKVQRYYFREARALPAGSVYVSPFDLNVEQDRIEVPIKSVIRFATPVMDAAGRFRGIVVLNYLGADLLRKFDEISRGFPGSVQLLDRDGGWLRGPETAAEWGWMLGSDRSMGKERPEAWRRIAGAEHGSFLDADGLYAFESVVLRADPAGDSTGAQAPMLKIVAHVPWGILRSRSRVLRERMAVASLLVSAVLAILAWFLARARTAREEALARLRDSEARLRVLSRALLTAQEEECKRISRDLHDDLGQLSTALCLSLERLGILSDGPRREAALEDARRQAQALLERVRDLASRLRPPLLDDLGLGDALQEHLADFEADTGIAVESELDSDRSDLPPEIGGQLFRIVQEALRNVARHSGAARVRVRLRTDASAIEVSVEDGGRGFDASAVAGTLGLTGMRERASLLEGEFRIETAPGKGTRVRVRIPRSAPQPAPRTEAVE